jgi:KTSC domain
MGRIELQSTSLKAADYQFRNAWLEVEFRTGAVYRYFGVPAWIYQEFLEAESKGRYFNQHIRNRFPTQKLM